ncbi:MAG: hypothetical protein Fur0042_02370 [Cyanophyceae cyanobacterium]
MTTYQEILALIRRLSLAEQLQLLSDLSQMVRQTARSWFAAESPPPTQLGLERWRGFLPKRVDPVTFQQQLRDEWE